MLLIAVCLAPQPALSAQAVVTIRTIYPGEIISGAELKIVELITKPRVRYLFERRVEDVAGKIATRTLLSGRFIKKGSARPAPMVRAGQQIQVMYQRSGLSIAVICVALGNGSAGDSIRLRNPSSGKIITGLVAKNGAVMVGRL